ncbi:D-tyrosyl-tRNA(Tyr) deacylase [Poriferisphaera corsica]|uniref:D-aminoacyl-tRNA deacylase n=1 Tax=Poriferisphaera corsica TaxID=2528020 RepID=A0A517YXC3_9BACT|nr:D-aminoacyl-tRNA deacylase [Poriferisphaera corsica]QDU34875.1 D-tyrosyl-tRNA(Tyr) deacylase [Poriferisphaera corsica]
MRVVLQRVSKGSVTVENQIVGQISRGYVILLGIGHADTKQTADKMADKIINLRIFNNDDGKFDLSLLDINGEALVVSQFTLFADCKKGRRPNFTNAGKPDEASPLCDYFMDKLKTLGIKNVQGGIFGAHMDVDIHNDGPVTIILDSEQFGF